MTGLLLKDLLVLQKSLKTYVLFLGGYLVMALMGLFAISFVTAMVQVILLMLPMSAFAYDDQAKWDRYAMSLPLGRRAVVGSRYLFLLVIVAIATAFNLASCLVVVLSGRSDGAGILEAVLAMLVSSGIGLLIAEVMLPLSYKMGPERARPFLYALVFLPMIALFAISKLGLLNGLDLSFLDRLSGPGLLGVFSLIPLAALAGMGVSYLVSCHIMAGKEF